jgi:hypothetical protein
MISTRAKTGALVAFALASGGCADRPGDRQPPPVADYSLFSLELRLPARVEPGRAVPMELWIRNESDRPAYLGVGDSATTFDLVVRKRDGTVVWNRMLNREALLVLMEHTVAPGQAIGFSDTWSQRSNDGALAGPGEYEVLGRVDTQEPDDLESPPRILVVAASPR